MSMAAGTRLSDLPDELLQRILYFVPAKEAASTAVLARRWRWLWPTPWTGAGVHLDSRSYERLVAGDYCFNGRRRAFFRDAMAALAKHESVKTLTIRVQEEFYDIRKFMFRDSYGSNNEDVPDIVDDVICHPACHGVEELHIESYDSSHPADGRKHLIGFYDLIGHGHYDLSFGSFPSQALRHVHITNCAMLASPPPDAFFPCLQELLLQSCGVSLDTLEAMVMASPELDTLHLDNVYIATQVCYAIDVDGYLDRDSSILIQSFCCPTVTTLVLLNCCYSRDFTIELDAPRVRRFRYSGKVDVFPLKTPPPDLRRVDLHIFGSQEDYTLFWPFLMNFRNTKALKLKLECTIEDITVADKNEYDELLNEMWFGNLERLEVDVKHEPACKGDAAVAIGNLLQCCPALVDLRLNLSIVEDYQPVLRNRKTRLDFRKSVSHFMHRKDQVVSFGGENTMSEVPRIPGLSDKWFNFNCLQFYLKRVSLQFCSAKCNGFGAQLAEFFFEKAMVLEEMYIDDGNHKMCSHVNRKLGGQSTNPVMVCSEYNVSPGIAQEVGVKRFSSFRIRDRLPINDKHEVRRRNSWSRGFTILPLDR